LRRILLSSPDLRAGIEGGSCDEPPEATSKADRVEENKEAMKQRDALKKTVKELFTSMFLSGAMMGGLTFLVGLISLFTRDTSFPWLVTISLVIFIIYVSWLVLISLLIFIIYVFVMAPSSIETEEMHG